MKKTIYFLLLLMISCNQKKTNHDYLQSKEDSNQTEGEKMLIGKEFELFLDSFPNLELPIVIKGCEIDYSKFPSINDGNTYYVGKFKTNGSFFATITLGSADCMLPILTTYNYQGKIINSEMLAIGYCGSGPCFECEEYMTIKRDFSFYTSDTIASSLCDENYDPISGTETIKVVYKTGRISESGKINLSKELKKKIK